MLTAREKLADALEILNQVIAENDSSEVPLAFFLVRQRVQGALAQLVDADSLAREAVAHRLLHRLYCTEN